MNQAPVADAAAARGAEGYVRIDGVRKEFDGFVAVEPLPLRTDPSDKKENTP
jgi:hypothetical protein